MNTALSKISRALRLKELRALTNLSPATIWRRSKQDPTFPKPFSIGPNSTAWDEQEVMTWLENCKANRNVGGGK